MIITVKLFILQQVWCWPTQLSTIWILLRKGEAGIRLSPADTCWSKPRICCRGKDSRPFEVAGNAGFIPFNTISSQQVQLPGSWSFAKNELSILSYGWWVCNLVYLRGDADSLYIAYYKPYTWSWPPSMLLPEKAIDYGPDTIVAVAYSDTLRWCFQPGIYLAASTVMYKRLPFQFRAFISEWISRGYDRTSWYLAPRMNSIKWELPKDQRWHSMSSDKMRRECWKAVADQIYYTRVLYATTFTSYKEGWRTEREWSTCLRSSR